MVHNLTSSDIRETSPLVTMWSVPLLGAPGRPPMPIYPLGLYKTNLTLVMDPRWAKEQQYPQLALVAVPELWRRGRLHGGHSELRLAKWPPPPSHPRIFDKTAFAIILTTRSRYPQDRSTISTWSRPWTLPGSSVAFCCWGHPAQVSYAHLPPGAR